MKISRYDVVYEKPPMCWQDGFVTGNGSLGAVYYAPEALTFLINKTDVIDARTKKARRIIPPEEAAEMIKNGASARDFHQEEILEEAPAGIGPKTCCKLELDLGMTAGSGTRSALPRISSRLSLSDASVNVAIDKHLCHPRLKAFVDADSDTFVMCADNISRIVSYRNRIFFSRPEDVQIGDPELWIENNRVYMKAEIPESGYYIVGMEIITRKTKACTEILSKCRPRVVSSETGSVKAEIKGRYIFIDVEGNFDLFLSVVSDRDSGNPLDDVNKNLDAALENGVEKIYSEHCRWWEKYWSKSKVELGDKALNDLFYRSLYAMGCAYRKAPISGLLGLCYGPCSGPIQYTPWNGDLHHDLNVQCSFFPVFAVNHAELFDAYRETYYNFLPEARRLAKEIFEAEGAHFSMCFNAHGKAISLGLGHYRYGLMGSYVALIHCIAWRYNQDTDELRERIYPFLKDVIKFYQSIMKKDETGIYRLWPAHACELDVLDCANPVQTMSMLKVCLETAIEGADILKTDSGLKETWEDMLENMPEYPTGIDQKGRKIILDGEGIPPDHHVGQAGCILPVYPCGEVDEFSGDDILQLYNETFESVLDKTAEVSYADDNTFYYKCVWACFFRAMTALRLGQKDKFWNLYLPMFLKAYVKPNGLCSHDACVVVEPALSEKNIENIPDESLIDVGEKMPKIEAWMGHAGTSTPNSDANRMSVPLIEANADFLTMITETLLQSHNGIIRVFPAWPKDKDASFENLKAEGDISVSSEMKDGKIVFLKLEKGRNCRLGKVKIKSPDSKEIKEYEFSENGIIEIES